MTNYIDLFGNNLNQVADAILFNLNITPSVERQYHSEVVSEDTDEMVIVTKFDGQKRIITASVTTNGIVHEEQFVSLSHWGMH